MTLSPVRTGLAVGLFAGLWHLAWSSLVALGRAQAVIDFILWIHFIDVPVRLQPFDTARAATLILVTGGLGFAAGWLLAFIWNGLHSDRRPARRPFGRTASRRG
jgi:thiamine transporter ThiT